MVMKLIYIFITPCYIIFEFPLLYSYNENEKNIYSQIFIQQYFAVGE